MIFNKRGESSISTAVKVAISVLLGGLILVGTISIINGTVADGITDTFEQGASIEGTLNTPSAPEEIVSAKEVFGNFNNDSFTEQSGSNVRFLSGERAENGFIVYTSSGLLSGSGCLRDKQTYDFGDTYDFSFTFATSDLREEVETYVCVGGILIQLTANSSHQITAYCADLVNDGDPQQLCTCTARGLNTEDKRYIIVAAGLSNTSNPWQSPAWSVDISVRVRKNKVQMVMTNGNSSSSVGYESPNSNAFCDKSKNIVELYAATDEGGKKAIYNFKGTIY